MSPHRIFLFLTVLTTGLSVGASDLYFIVHGIDSSLGGVVSAGIYASEDDYLEPGFQIASTEVVINGDTATGVFENLPSGRFVIALLHDLDGDRIMKKNGLGLPQEGYGFSGTGRPVTIPPSYKKAAVELNGGEDKTVDAYMKY